MQKNINKVIAGKRSKVFGEMWENTFEYHAKRQGINVVKIPPGCKRLGKFKLIQIPSPFDYCLCWGGISAHVDTKMTDQTNFTFSMIVPHQLESLSKLESGGPAGYVINMNERVYFASAALLRSVQPKGHLDLNNAVDLGHKLNFNLQRIFA